MDIGITPKLMRYHIKINKLNHKKQSAIVCRDSWWPKVDIGLHLILHILFHTLDVTASPEFERTPKDSILTLSCVAPNGARTPNLWVVSQTL